MRKFNDNDPLTWISQMEQFFNPHKVPTLQKVTIASLYLELDQFYGTNAFVTIKKGSIVTWSIFMDELSPYYGDIESNTFL